MTLLNRITSITTTTSIAVIAIILFMYFLSVKRAGCTGTPSTERACKLNAGRKKSTTNFVHWCLVLLTLDLGLRV